MKECFIIIPFSGTTETHTEKYWNQFYMILEDVLKEAGYCCTRSEIGPYKLISQIIDKINCCDLAIAVLTDLNPNVWYELGIRHSLKNGTIMLMQLDQKIPFDISSYGVITYDDGISLNLYLKDEIGKYIKKLETGSCDSPILDTLHNAAPSESYKQKLDKMYDLILKLAKEQNVEGSGLQFSKNRNNRILWVDDYPSNNELVISLFEEKGIRFDIAVNTYQAISLYKENCYDLIITDMGRGNQRDAGLKLIEELNKLDCSIPVIVYASRTAIKSYGTEAYKAGAKAVVNGMREIISLISEVVTYSEK